MAFRMDKLTVKAQEAVERSQNLATEQGNPEITPLHLLAGLLQEGEGFVSALIEKIGGDVAAGCGIRVDHDSSGYLFSQFDPVDAQTPKAEPACS